MTTWILPPFTSVPASIFGLLFSFYLPGINRVRLYLAQIPVLTEALRAKIDSKSAISLQRGQFDAKFQVEVVAPHQPFMHGKLGQ